MKYAIINIDSLPVGMFKESCINVGDYTATHFEKIKARPGFSFLGELATKNPPSKTELWMDFILSNQSPYRSIKFGSSKITNRKIITRKILMLIARIISGRCYNPINIPTSLLKFFDEHPKIKWLRNHFNEILTATYKTNAAAFAGDIDKIESFFKKTDHDFVFVNYSKLDKIGHLYGPNSNEYRNYTQQIFSSIEDVLKMKKFDKIEIISDHGMYSVKKYIDPLSIVDNLKSKNFITFVNSPVLRLWSIKNKKIPEKIIGRLSDLEEHGMGEILNAEHRKKFQLPVSRVFGDTIFWLKRGHHFLPDYFTGTLEIKGMHGYLEWDTRFLYRLKLREATK